MLNLAQNNFGLGWNLAQNKTFKDRRSKGSDHIRELEAVNLSTPRVRIYKRIES